MERLQIIRQPFLFAFVINFYVSTVQLIVNIYLIVVVLLPEVQTNISF